MICNPIAPWLFILLVIDVSCSSRDINTESEQEEVTVTGRVVKILDGDTYDILLAGNKNVRIRMEGIDAPERGMPFYRVSKNYLADLCMNEVVEIKITGKDAYDRLLAYTFLSDGRELGHEMVKAGLAWHFKKYNSDSTLAELEIEARNAKRGLWIDKNPVPPWDNRSYRRKGNSTKDSF